MKEQPKTFAELFKNTGIEPHVDKNGNTTYTFSATKKLKNRKNETSNTTVNRTTQTT